MVGRGSRGALRGDTPPFRLGNHDPTFAWVTAREPAMEPWRAALAEWVRGVVHPAPAMQHGRALVRYLWQHPTAARDPETFCRAGHAVPVTLASFLERPDSRSNEAAKTHNGLYRFFDWLLHDRPSGPLADGRGTYGNPLSRKTLTAGPGRTHRKAMPLALLDAMADVLTGDDHAWPKTLSEDWITDVHGARVWCPARAVALLIKVRLPLRTVEVRFLESGEGDVERLTPQGWVTNPTPYCTGGRGPAPRRGFLRRLASAGEGGTSGSDQTLFFINTSKGYDRLRHPYHPGRVLPWPQPEVARAVQALEAWQERHNPVEPVRWATLKDERVSKDPAAYARHPDAWFLFRDPSGEDRAAPISDDRLRSMWLALMDETERRMKEGRYPALAAAIPRLISGRTATGLPHRAIYDLHTMRVTYTTALHEANVAPAVISRCLGHANERMTAHYYAPSETTLAAALTEAEARLRESRPANLAACEVPGTEPVWLPARRAVGSVPFEEEGAMAAVAGLPNHVGWGLCPVAGRRCQVGGPVNAAGVHGPAAGGADRCLGCRFFGATPAHLPGLLDRLNGLSLAFGRCITTYWRREFAARQFEDGWNAEGGASTPAAHEAHQRARQRADVALGELIALQPTWEAAFALATRCRAATRADDGVLDLVLNGTAEDWSEAHAAAPQPDVLRALVQGMRVHHGPDAAARERARAVADRLVREHVGTPPLASLEAQEARAAATAHGLWRDGVARAHGANDGGSRATLWSYADGGCAK